jgi:hypothetical protein
MLPNRSRGRARRSACVSAQLRPGWPLRVTDVRGRGYEWIEVTRVRTDGYFGYRSRTVAAVPDGPLRLWHHVRTGAWG